jgi:hypothetical protein
VSPTYHLEVTYIRGLVQVDIPAVATGDNDLVPLAGGTNTGGGFSITILF